MKRITYLLLLAMLVMGCSSEPQVKYVFYFIGDGMGVNEVIGTNLYNQANGQENVNFTGFPVVNFITTVSANSLVTDSSAAGTALATGVIFIPVPERLWIGIGIIGLVSFLFSICGYHIGKYMGKRFKVNVELIGGIILVLIGIKIWIEGCLL